MNPFRQLIVRNAWDDLDVDVPSIHAPVFRACEQAIESVRQERHSTGVVIHGEAGSGKTHLLARLRHRLKPRQPTATDREEHMFVWVRLQTDPRMIWRTVRKTLVDDWFRHVVGHRSQFERILFHRLAPLRPAQYDLEPWYEYVRDQDPHDLERMIDQVCSDLEVDRNTTVAFKHIAFDRHKRDLQAWLAGTSLPPEVMQRMELNRDEGSDEEREHEARDVVLMLCRLAGNGLPVVLTFDQVEALEVRKGDSDGLYAFAQLVSTLHDLTSNVVLITCVQTAYAMELENRIREADNHRMTSFGKFSLDPLGTEQAAQLISARLRHYRSPLPAESSENRFWPASEAELFPGPIRTITPRRLLTICAERFEDWQQRQIDRFDDGPVQIDDGAHVPSVAPPPSAPPKPTPTLEEALAETWATAYEQKLKNTPDQTETIVRHGLPLLAPLIDPTVQLVRDETLHDVALVFERDSSRYGVALCTAANMTSLASQLKRLKEQYGTGRLKQLAIIRDPRTPLSPTANKARQYLIDLERQGADVVYPGQEVLAALDTLRELLSDAKSGDLSPLGTTVGPETVSQWLIANIREELRLLTRRLIGAVSEEAVVVPIDGPAPGDAQLLEAVHAQLLREPVCELAVLAQAVGSTPEQVGALAQRYPDQFGLVGEPSQVLFRAIVSGHSEP